MITNGQPTFMQPIAVALVILLPTAAPAQSPHFNDSSVWSEEVWRFEGLEAHHLLYTITVQGDTVIQGQAYKRLRRQGTATIAPLLGNPPPPPKTIAIDAYAGALRTEGDAARWWAVLPGAPAPQLLYDFNLTVGDTVAGTYGDCNAAPIVVSIDTYWFNERAHRRYMVTGGRYLIEGIGTSAGLFGLLCPLFEEYSCLQSYAQDAALWEVSGCSPLLTGAPALVDGSAIMPAHPNPTSGSIVVPALHPDQDAMLHDLAGRLVAVVRTDGQCRIDLGPLPAGTYMLRPSTASSHHTPQRLVKQ